MAAAQWREVGSVEELRRRELTAVRIDRTAIALTYRDGAFHAVSGVCNHAGGPLGEGRLEGDYIVCPWHYWKFHHSTGEGEPGFEEDRVPSHETRIESGRLFVNLTPKTPRHKKPQDNIQAVAGQMLGFFAEIGFVVPQFPYVAHSRGWTAEDMEKNVDLLRSSHELRDGVAALVERCTVLAGRLMASEHTLERVARGGRKAFRLEIERGGSMSNSQPALAGKGKA